MKKSSNNIKGAGFFKNVRYTVNNFIQNYDDNLEKKQIDLYYSKNKSNMYDLTLKKRKNIRKNIINLIINIINNIRKYEHDSKKFNIHNQRLFKIIEKINNYTYSYFKTNFYEHINFDEGKHANFLNTSNELRTLLHDFVLKKLAHNYFPSDIKKSFDKIENIKNVNYIIKFIIGDLYNKYNIKKKNPFIPINSQHFLWWHQNDYFENVTLNIIPCTGKKTKTLTLDHIKKNENPDGNQKYIKLLKDMNYLNINIHAPSLKKVLLIKINLYQVTIIREHGNLQDFMYEHNDPYLHINALQQLFLACILFHKLSGFMHGNININNIHYYKIDQNSTDYLGYDFKILNNVLFIKNMGYLWILSDFSETFTISNNANILFNPYYKILNNDYEPYHMYFEYRAILEMYKEYLKYTPNVSNILKSYVDNLLNVTKNLNRKYKKELLNDDDQKLYNLDLKIFRSIMKHYNFLLHKDIKKQKQKKVYFSEI